LKLGGVEVDAPVVDLSQQKKGSFTDPYVAGNVGAGVLKRFNVTFDYGHQRIIFEPNVNTARPDTCDRAGVWLNRASDGFEVMDVVAGGSAEAAGVKVGFRIAAIDDTPAEKLSLPAVRERFRNEPAGTVVKLTVLEGGARREVTLVLRDLVPRS
jgi:S1-C subfamily serine protease